MKSGQNKQGFTIVELLIVIVIIAILAALTLISFNGISGRSKSSSVKTDTSKLTKALELQRTDDGAYPVSLDSTASNLPYMKFSANNSLTKYTSSGTSFRFCISNEQNSVVGAFAVFDSASGLVNSGTGAGPTADCTPPLPEFVGGVRCPVITFGTPFSFNATQNRVSVIYNDATISRITRIDTNPVTNTYIDQGAVRRHDFLKSAGLNWNDVTMNVLGSNGFNRTDCRVTFSWPAE